MNKAFQEAAEAIKKAQSVVLAIHVQPDGDAFGSLLAMSRYLKQKGKPVCMTWGEKITIPAQYKWMPGIDEVIDFNDCIGGDLLITLDCANEHRLGLMESILTKFKTIINVDHHVDNSRFGTINVLDFNAGATAQIVYELLRFMNGTIDADTATLLYTGIVTDTGRFQYQNTTAKTLCIASELVGLGVNPNQIFHNIYENLSYNTLKLLAKVLSRAAYLSSSRLIYSYVEEEDFEQTGAEMGDTETFIDFLRMTKEADVAAVFKEFPDGKLRVSLRSKGNIDVGAIAREGGGGGHRNAAGCTLEQPLDEAVKWLAGQIMAQQAASATG